MPEDGRLMDISQVVLRRVYDMPDGQSNPRNVYRVLPLLDEKKLELKRDSYDIKEIVRLEHKVKMLAEDLEPLERKNRELTSEAVRLRQENGRLSGDIQRIRMGTSE